MSETDGTPRPTLTRYLVTTIYDASGSLKVGGTIQSIYLTSEVDAELTRLRVEGETLRTKLDALIADWRQEARFASAGDHFSNALKACANKLAALLAAPGAP